MMEVETVAVKRKDKTIFREILRPLLSVLALEMLFMMGAILLGGVIDRLNQNATDMLAQKTENRSSYLLGEMIGRWSDLELLSEEIDDKVQERMNQGLLSLTDLSENSSATTDLLKDMAPSLINTMYNKKISGIFVIFHTKGLEEEDVPEAMQGIYLRDLDPRAAPSERNADLLWERAPVDLVRAGYIATDAGWQPAFSREDSVEKDYFRKPFQAAYTDEDKLNEKEYGYWTTEPYILSGDGRTAISFSVPLLLEDGTIYGVLGVELLTDYVASLLPASELLEEQQGTYLLAAASGEGTSLTPIVSSGVAMNLADAGQKRFTLLEEGYAQDEKGEYYAAAKKLGLYSNHAPFESDQWYLLGIGSKKSLFEFSRQIQKVLFFSVILTCIVGLAGIVYASYKLSKPIQRLSEEVAKAQSDNSLPELSATGIREIDRFADSISRLGREVVASSTRLLSIIDMASVEMAGYELRRGIERVYVTDNYFPLLGVRGVDSKSLTPDVFREWQEKLHSSLDHFELEDGSVVYSVHQEDGSIHYIRSEHQEKEGRQIGLIEDVTVSTLEKMRIEKERDTDNLTKLYARRGFQREAEVLFSRPEVMKHAGLLMIDLDNLKTTNDRFGHNFGDLYIQTAGKCFLDNTPKHTVCARMSGDEFILLFYGYDSREEIREKVEALYKAIREVAFILPNGDNMGLSASGGLAYYPDDSGELPELMKFADFAMYQVKESRKGEYREFEQEVYTQYLLRNQSRLELCKALETQDINYFFQPIFESREGRVYAYEALMRVNLPTLRSPEVMLRLAKEEGRMHDIEYITMFRATSCYRKLLEEGEVSKDALLFINSIANERMTEEEEEQYHILYKDIQDRVVVEITEAEHLDMELINKKSQVKGFSGIYALDDYGSGYNSEVNLLKLNPKYVKVDITIVRDVDKDANKQQIISNIVNYAHKRDMRIIAEGLETAEELRKVLELGVDLLQGYYLARPGEKPPAINEEALGTIREYWGQRES